ncbi:MAG: restriction endonuclease subunit S domain-containing protein [Syntrophales bacterium]
MALRARLVAPPPEPRQVWPWHTPKFASMPSALFLAGDRRMEAETYLSSGFGLRTAIESKRTGWVSFGKLARVWMPNRLKGIVVSPEYGTPFLAATQVFDIRPTPRKWLSLERTENAAGRFVTSGMILVTCSGSVGRATLAYRPHENTLISHDLLRVEPMEEKDRGWLYAYLHAPQVRAMASGAHYGNIIKHLETSHLEALPVPLVDDDAAADFSRRVSQIFALRNESYRLSEEADRRFADALGPITESALGAGFAVRASDFFGNRRRLEACYHSPRAASIFKRFKRWKRLDDVTERVWWISRFKRVYGEDGIPYLSADELFTVNPSVSKKILLAPDDGHEAFFVKRGWIIMARSGQAYGLNGAAMLMTEHHENIFFSDDFIRIIPDRLKIRPGYLLVTLTHRTHGRPLLIRAIYGTSIPHLDPGDVADFPVVRLKGAEEAAIADLAERSAAARAEADLLERSIGRDAGLIIDRFMAQI